MNLTNEQEKIINTTSSIRVNAVAGSGKTTTLVAYAKSRPINSSILYLAFNKSVKEEAIRKFSHEGLSNVRVETAHSLAFRHIVIGQGYKVAFHSIQDIGSFLYGRESLTLPETILITHVQKFTSFFCNSIKDKVDELDYRDILSEEEELVFVEQHYSEILLATRRYLAGMYKKQIPISHDFYLKLFQLSNPSLQYHYILFDEAQDASPVMVDVIQKQQKSVRIIVGDTHQQIYSWRYAVNSMALFDFPIYNLTTSFRLSHVVAKLAMSVLDVKDSFTSYKKVSIRGFAEEKRNITTKATIARTNIALLAEAIAFVATGKKSLQLYFEGHIRSYLFGEEGGALSDVLNLSLDKRKFIRNKTILAMPNIDELEEYAEQTGDRPMLSVIDLVKKYGDKLSYYLSLLWKRHVDERESADMIFSTVHKCKGMEYDAVYLCNDFLDEKSLLSILKEDDEFDLHREGRFIEEINLLYVAITRVKKVLFIPKVLIPKAFKGKKEGYIRVTSSEESLQKLHAIAKKSTRFPKSVVRKAEGSSYSGKSWNGSEERRLIYLYNQGISVEDLAKRLRRSRVAIEKRLQKLNENGRLYEEFET